MRSDRVSTLGLLAGLLHAAPAVARPDARARSQQIRRQNAQDCLEDLEDILDDAPTTSLWPVTACDYTSTLSGAELTSNYASYRSHMASWYSRELEDITSIEISCTQYVSVFDQIRYCYVTGPLPTPTASTASTASTTPTLTAATTTASRTSTGATSTSTSSSTSTPSPGDGGGLDPGAKAGLAIGVVLAVILILFICWHFFQKYRSTRLAGGAGEAVLKGGDAELPQTQSAAAVGGGATAGAAGLGMAAAAARTKLYPPESSVYAYKSELDGEPRPVSELDPAAAVVPPRSLGSRPNVAELDPEPPTQLSELPANNYDPTADGSPPPAYVSPVNGTDRDRLDSAVSPLSPDSSTTQTRGLGISSGAGSSGGASGHGAGSAPLVVEDEGGNAQHGWGRGWLRRG